MCADENPERSQERWSDKLLKPQIARCSCLILSISLSTNLLKVPCGERPIRIKHRSYDTNADFSYFQPQLSHHINTTRKPCKKENSGRFIACSNAWLPVGCWSSKHRSWPRSPKQNGSDSLLSHSRSEAISAIRQLICGRNRKAREASK